jgi:predicted ArsR family transcriptional regulator
LQEFGEQVAQEFSGRVEKHSAQTEKVSEVAAIMRELGYDTDVTLNNENYSEIIASNCVFHKLAEECHGVCTLDLSLLASLLNADIEHKKCIIKGDKNCCFGVLAKTAMSATRQA